MASSGLEPRSQYFQILTWNQDPSPGWNRVQLAARLAQPRESSLHPLPPWVLPSAPAPGESREAPSATGKQPAASGLGRWGGAGAGPAGPGAGPGQGAESPTGSRRQHPSAAPRAGSRPRCRHGGLPGRLLSAQLRESPLRRLLLAACSLLSCLLPPVSSFSFLQTCLSGPAPCRLALWSPCHSEPPTPSPRPLAPGTAAVLSSGYCAGGVGARRGGGGECTPRGPLPGIGETEAQSPSCGWALRPHLVQLGAVLAVRLSLVSAGRSDSLCGVLGSCPSLPWALLCPSVRHYLFLSVCLSLSICICLISASVRLLVCLCPSVDSPSLSVAAIRCLPVCPPVHSVSLHPCLCLIQSGSG